MNSVESCTEDWSELHFIVILIVILILINLKVILIYF